MALRIREDGRILCAALHPAEPSDTYLHDGMHYKLTVETRVIVTEPMHGPGGRGGHVAHGEWWWQHEVPDDVVIEGLGREELMDGRDTGRRRSIGVGEGTWDCPGCATHLTAVVGDARIEQDADQLVRENEAAIQVANEESARLRAAPAAAEARAFAAKTRGNLRGRWRRSAHAFYMLSMRLAIRDRHELKQGNRRLASELAEEQAIRREELAAHQVVVRRAIAAEGELVPLRELAERMADCRLTSTGAYSELRRAIHRARTALGRTDGD